MLRRYVELSCEVNVLPWLPRLYTKSDYQNILVYCPRNLLLMRRSSLRPPCTQLLSLICMTLVPLRTKLSRMFCPTNSQICGSELEEGTGKHLKKFSNLWVCVLKVVLDSGTDVIFTGAQWRYQKLGRLQGVFEAAYRCLGKPDYMRHLLYHGHWSSEQNTLSLVMSLTKLLPFSKWKKSSARLRVIWLICLSTSALWVTGY